MSISQVDVNILGRQFTIGTPDEEAETLRQAVYLLNQKIGVIQDTGRIVETDKIVIMAVSFPWSSSPEAESPIRPSWLPCG